MPAPEFFLYDKVSAWTYDKPEKAMGAHTKWTSGIIRQASDTIASNLRRYRNAIRQAERFYISDEMVYAALAAGRESAKLEGWINLARAPFPATWIECSLHSKVAASHSQGALIEAPDYTLVPENIGWLIEELDPDTGLFRVTTFVADRQDGGADIAGAQWVVAPEGTSHDYLRIPKGMYDLADMFGRKPFPPELAAIGMTTFRIDGPKAIVMGSPWVKGHLALAHEPITRAIHASTLEAAAQRPRARDEIMAELINVFYYTLQEESGTVRFLVAILAMMNEAPTVKRIHPPRPGYHTRGMNKLRYLNHTHVELKLPKTKPMVYLSKLLDRASSDRRRNRAHMVRGHFRQIERGLPGIHCKHEPTMVEDGVGICARCERIIRWVPSFERGDAALGWVNHDYELVV